MTMHFQLIAVVTCLGQIADSRSHRSSTKQNHGTLHDNHISDDALAEGSGAIDVLEVTSLNDQPTIHPKPTTETSSCTPEYAAIRGHTMCLLDSPEVTSYGVSNQEQEDIVKLHNSLRNRVEPPATDLDKLTWDERLAAVADKWARQCKMDHDVQRSIPGYGLSIGQNVAGGYRDWATAIMAWYNEVKLYRYGEDPERYLGKDGWKKVGHYTQIVQNSTSIVGCGFADCPRTKYGRFFVCNYASGQTRISFPYTRGERCSSCPNTCTAGLCDCGGKICFNGGTLDKDICKCSCPSLYIGPTCHQLNCPTKDSFYCGRSLVEKDCNRYANVPHLCPYMCGICGSSLPTKATSGPSSESRGDRKSDRVITTQHISHVRPTSATFISEHGCTYSGQRASKAECLTYGDHGSDMSACESMGGTRATCDHCHQFYNVKTDYCPVMCGLCDAPCRGKRCLNGGRLDVSTCTCTCKAPYEGNTCQTVNCPARDPIHCLLYRTSYCERFVNVPSECPHLCGIC